MPENTHARSATRPPCWLGSCTFSYFGFFYFFLQALSNLKGVLDKTEASYTQTAELCLHMIARCAYILDIACDKYIFERTATWAATITWVEMSGRQMWG